MGCKASRSRIIPTHASYKFNKNESKQSKYNKNNSNKEVSNGLPLSSGGGESSGDRTPTFSEIQIDIIKSTWPLIEENLAEHGMAMFLHIFKMEPDAKRLFDFRDVDNDHLLDSPSFQVHATAVMSTVGVVAENIEELEPNVSNHLMLLGAKHGTIGNFSMLFMSMFMKCMETTWQQVLREEYTDSVEEVWLIVFAYIENRLRDGFHIYALSSETADITLTDT